jgi:hypothetical protein
MISFRLTLPFGFESKVCIHICLKSIVPSRKLLCRNEGELKSNTAQIYEISWANHIRGDIYEIASRINHLCIPNLSGHGNPNIGPKRFYAIRQVEPGEELTVLYVPHLYDGKEERVRLCQERGFTCSCELCIGSLHASLAQQDMHDLLGGQKSLSDQDMNRSLEDWLRCKQVAIKMAGLQGHALLYDCLDL